MQELHCPFCPREFTNAGCLGKHVKHCKSNPNFVKGVRSPLAGRQKGSTPWNKGLKDDRHYNEKWTDEQAFIKNSPVARHLIKHRVIVKKLIPYECKICHQGGEWNSIPLTLQLDHINGVRDDHRLKNLRFLCPNCHTQQNTYAAKNRTFRKSGRVADCDSLENC